jgi:uncharacterized DUF497 family protein
VEFEWDTAKEAANEAKHGIGFARAATVFDDPHHLEEDTTKPEYGEQRGMAIGKVGPHVITVICTDRQGRRRIISARRASKDERERYDQSTTAR